MILHVKLSWIGVAFLVAASPDWETPVWAQKMNFDDVAIEVDCSANQTPYPIFHDSLNGYEAYAKRVNGNFVYQVFSRTNKCHIDIANVANVYLFHASGINSPPKLVEISGHKLPEYFSSIDNLTLLRNELNSCQINSGDEKLLGINQTYSKSCARHVKNNARLNAVDVRFVFERRTDGLPDRGTTGIVVFPSVIYFPDGRIQSW